MWKYALSVFHHFWKARPPSAAVEGPVFLNNKNQPCSGKTKSQVHKSGPGDSKSFFKKFFFQNQPNLFFLFFKVAGLSTPWACFYMYASSFRPATFIMIYQTCTNFVSWSKSGNCSLIPRGGNRAFAGHSSEGPFRAHNKIWFHRSPALNTETCFS